MKAKKNLVKNWKIGDSLVSTAAREIYPLYNSMRSIDLAFKMLRRLP